MEQPTKELRRPQQKRYPDWSAQPVTPFDDLRIALEITEAYRFGLKMKAEIASGQRSEAAARFQLRLFVAMKDLAKEMTLVERDHLSQNAFMAAGISEYGEFEKPRYPSETIAAIVEVRSQQPDAKAGWEKYKEWQGDLLSLIDTLPKTRRVA